MTKLLEILRASTLSSTMSDMEIEEVVEEIRPDFEDYFEEEKESIRESFELGARRDNAEINRLRTQLDKLERTSAFKVETLRDRLAVEWVTENWDWICKLENLNKSGKEIYQTYQWGETLNQMGKDAAPSISKMIDSTYTLSKIIDNEIIEGAKSLGFIK